MKTKGKLALKTLTMPKDTNANGDIFGGWLLAQMDLAGAICAKSECRSRVVTVAIESMTFHRPVPVGCVLECYTKIKKIGTMSMQIIIEAWVTDSPELQQAYRVTQGIFTYVAIDSNKNPCPIKR